jgi:hypothetical protein
MKDPDHDGARNRLERRRHRGDVAIIVGSLLTILAVMAAAALAAWKLSTGDERIAATAPTQIVSPSY